jgi:hypothetical protein
MSVASRHVAAVANYWRFKRDMTTNRNNRYAPDNTNDEKDAPGTWGANPNRTEANANRALPDNPRIATNRVCKRGNCRPNKNPCNRAAW